MSHLDFSWIFNISTWIGLLTLIILEIVLGIDNLVFVSILSNKVNPILKDNTRIIGLSLAIITRIIMLIVMSYINTLTKTLFTIDKFNISGKDILMILGGFFLIYKATNELHEKLDNKTYYSETDYFTTKFSNMWVVILQILLLDAIFSIDSVITAIHVVNNIEIAIIAIILSMSVMILSSKPLSKFINENHTIVILCLGYLLMIGLSLICSGFHFNIPKGYLYTTICFSILIEIFNQIHTRNRNISIYSGKSWRKRASESILGFMGIRENFILKSSFNKDHTDEEIFAENEKNMIRNVLSLAEKPIISIMTPRKEIEKLDISLNNIQQKEKLINTLYSRLIVVDESGIDEPLGYISKKDLLNDFIEDNNLDIKSNIKQPLILPETISALNTIEQFRKTGYHMALVVNEFGEVVGLITMKNLMETIIGEFPESYELSQEPSIKENSDNSFTIDGSLEYEELAKRIPLPNLKEKYDFYTINGLLLEEFEHIPKTSEFVDYYGWRFIVEKMNNQKIEKVRVCPIKEI